MPIFMSVFGNSIRYHSPQAPDGSLHRGSTRIEMPLRELRKRTTRQFQPGMFVNLFSQSRNCQSARLTIFVSVIELRFAKRKIIQEIPMHCAAWKLDLQSAAPATPEKKSDRQKMDAPLAMSRYATSLRALA